MQLRRLSAIIVMFCVFNVLGAETHPVDNVVAQKSADPKPLNPPQGWIKQRQIFVDKQLDLDIQELVELYQHIHSNPELSLMEVKTAARLAEEVRKLGYDVTEKVGGNGVVAVLKNGPGPVVLIRTDMDALPIVEQTGLPYASKVKVKDLSGNDVGVMHACGHDIHMA